MRKTSLLMFTRLALTLTCLAIGLPAAYAEPAPMTPEMAAKASRVKKQQADRITPAKRKAAAEALKARRVQIHEAKMAAASPPRVNPGGQKKEGRP